MNLHPTRPQRQGTASRLLLCLALALAALGPPAQAVLGAAAAPDSGAPCCSCADRVAATDPCVPACQHCGDEARVAPCPCCGQAAPAVPVSGPPEPWAPARGAASTRAGNTLPLPDTPAEDLFRPPIIPS